MVQTRQTFIPTARRTPVVQRPLRITGRIVYPEGPWGSNRPLAHRGGVMVYKGYLEGPERRRTRSIPAGFIPGPALLSWGSIVTLYKGPWVSGEEFTDGKGQFIIRTQPIDSDTDGLVLEVRDYNPASDGQYPHGCIHELIPGAIDINSQVSSQGVGTIRLPWWPPQFMTGLAVVNGQVYVDTQKLARALCALLRSPSFPTKITLSRESALGQRTAYTNYDDFTAAESLLEDLGRTAATAGFSDRIVTEVSRIPRLQTNAKSAADAIQLMLERLITVTIKQLEEGTILNGLLKALSTALGGSGYESLMEDPAPDMAAACVLLFAAGAVAKYHAKVRVNFSSTKLANYQKILNIEVEVGK